MASARSVDKAGSVPDNAKSGKVDVSQVRDLRGVI
jgi:hypothetical protein